MTEWFGMELNSFTLCRNGSDRIGQARKDMEVELNVCVIEEGEG